MLELKRNIIEICIAITLAILWFSIASPAAIALLLQKALQVSLGFLHAHLIGKLFFPKVNWEEKPSYLRIALYVVVIYAYALGG